MTAMTIETTMIAGRFGVAEPELRTPPHNIEAEQALLGAVLMNNEAAQRVTDFLKPAHFYEPVHGRIFEVACTLIDRGQVADAVTCKHYFEADGALVEIGGAQYLAHLAAAATSLLSVEHYGRLVYDLALRRELIRIGDDMTDRAALAELDDNAMRQIESAEQELFQLAETGARERGFVSFGDALTEAIQMADAAYKHDGEVVGVATGLADLDGKLGGLHPSDLLVLAARPAMGKTSLATNIAFHAANTFRHDGGEASDGAVVAFFSLEMSAEQLATRILAEQAEISSDRIRRGMISHEDEWPRLVQVSRRLQDIPLFIDDTPALSISGVRTRARRLMRTQGLGLIVVDYLQLLRGSDGTENRVQELSEITRGLKALAKELNVPVLALSQLSRQVENREDKRPQLADLRESGSIEQDADVVMFIFREEYYHERKEPEPDTPAHAEWLDKAERVHGIAEVIIGKQRHGPTGTVKLMFDREHTRFRNLDMGHAGANEPV